MKKLLQNKKVIYITLMIGLPIYFIGMIKDLDLLLPVGIFFCLPALFKIFGVIEQQQQNESNE